MLKPLVKGMPILTMSSVMKLKKAFEDNEESLEATLQKIYNVTNDILQQLLIEELCKAKGFTLVPFTEEPKTQA